jgi:hypothetical protein
MGDANCVADSISPEDADVAGNVSEMTPVYYFFAPGSMALSLSIRPGLDGLGLAGAGLAA